MSLDYERKRHTAKYTDKESGFTIHTAQSYTPMEGGKIYASRNYCVALFDKAGLLTVYNSSNSELTYLIDEEYLAKELERTLVNRRLSH